MKSRVHFVITPVLLDIEAAGKVLSVSEWTIRSLVAAGLLPTVELPSVRPSREKNRRLLFHIDDLTAFANSRRRKA